MVIVNLKRFQKSSVLTLTLIRGTDLPKLEEGEHYYVVFKYGDVYLKSKPSSVTNEYNYVEWNEQFQFDIHDDYEDLKIELWKNNIYYGINTYRLINYFRDITYNTTSKFSKCSGEVHVLLAVSGIASEIDSRAIELLANEYHKTLHPCTIKDLFYHHQCPKVGILEVTIFEIYGINRSTKIHPYCVLRLVNDRLQTHTLYDIYTKPAIWNRSFTFPIKDISSALVVQLYHEEYEPKLLGSIEIPLLRIQNDVKRWYVLKSENFTRRKHHPQILLRMFIIWTPSKAFLNSVNYSEPYYLEEHQKFSRKTFSENARRLKIMITDLMKATEFIHKCMSWESKLLSFFAMNLYILICLFIELWNIPLIMLLILAKNAIKCMKKGKNIMHSEPDIAENLEEYEKIKNAQFYESLYDDDENQPCPPTLSSQKKKKSFYEKFHNITELITYVQNEIEMIVSVQEKFKNAFNFVCPEMTLIGVAWLILIFLLFYFGNPRYIFALFGTYKFLKKLFKRRRRKPTNEIMNFISRVPDNSQLVKYLELKPNYILDVNSDVFSYQNPF